MLPVNQSLQSSPGMPGALSPGSALWRRSEEMHHPLLRGALLILEDNCASHYKVETRTSCL